MNKTAIKNFAVWARNKLIADISYRAGLMGITESGIASALPQSTGTTEFYDIGTAEPYAISGDAVRQRRRLVELIERKEKETDYKTAYKYIIEEVAYTWFNRLIAVRFMEVNDYLPSHIRVLSSESGKMEPDLVTAPFDAELEFTSAEEKQIIQLKQDNKVDELFKILFVKQCNALNKVLPYLFETTKDYSELLLNLSFIDQDGIVYKLTHEIDEDDFNIDKGGQVEIIGWLYQYYNTELKDETFALLKKNVKISKERIPSATQLFTPDWIVRYMVENSLGRIWVDTHPNEELKDNWLYYLEESEDNVESGSKVSIDKDIDVIDLKVIDPCMGSGHILVYCFDVLMQIYVSQGYSQRDAAKLILDNNIFGLDIDKRAAQLSYFAVMMKARQYDRRIFSRDVKLNIFAIEESNHINRGHLKYFGKTLNCAQRNDAINQMERLLDSLVDAKEYGSILTVESYNEELLWKYVYDLDDAGQMTFETVGISETQKTLIQFLSIYGILAQKYHAVITNPPYMGSSGMDSKLLKYVKENYPDSKSDFFSVFIEKCKEYTIDNGCYAMITQPSFLFLSSFEKLRNKILSQNTILNLLHLGRGIFGIDFGSTAFVIRKQKSISYKGRYFKLYERTFQYLESNHIAELFLLSKKNPEYRFDFSNYDTKSSISEMELEQKNAQRLSYEIRQSDFEKIPGLPIAYWAPKGIIDAFTNGKPLGKLTVARNGMKTGDNNRFLRNWWEVENINIMLTADNIKEAMESKKKWFPYNKGGDSRKWYGNNEYIVNWENGGHEIFGMAKQDGRNVQDYPAEMKFVPSGTWSLISSGKPTFRYKKNNISDIAGMSFYNGGEKTKYYLGFCNTNIAASILQMLAPTINYQAGDIGRLPIYYDKNKEQEIIQLVDECIDISRDDWDSFETSWDFKKHPLIKETERVQDAYELWEEECKKRISKLKTNEETLNRLFADIYKLQKEYTTEVEEEEIVIHKAEIEADIKSLLSYAVGCILGRYSIDNAGVVFAGGQWGNSQFISFIPDKDNIVPITDEEYLEDDIVTRFCAWMRCVYGDKYLEENLDFIAQVLGNKGKTSREIIRNYFINDFIKDHIKMYQKRPIYWLYDSGKQNGFKALVYMHRYNADTIGNLRIDYLHRIQRIYESEINRMQDTIDHSLNAREVAVATKRKEKLQKQLKECREYDEKIGHLALSRIDIDLDDGVKVNYEKVQTASDGKKYQVLAKI